METITSRQNPLCVHIRKLGAERKYRRSQGQFLCEGDKLVEEALRWDGGVEVLLCAGETEPPEGVPQGVRLVRVPEALMKSLSTVETPQHRLAVCRRKDRTPPEPLPAGSYLVLDGVQDPGNVGTIWRTADALGAEGLFLLNGCADPFSPKVVRSTMGACFRMPVWETDLEGLCRRLEESGIPLYATALRTDTADVRHIGLRPAAVVIGSEGRGVSAPVLERCAQTIRIPMRERCESLNAAAAAAVVLWEMARGL
ncbi:RNA methyltransferase [Pseudoflavonifractor sp. MSJ-37]|uniref:TrmH family RNA methyltransferase n=1 Tax=Pseudoflavonifractor sp. MSJ-37 TaxID=2841531 RepID=UPI001C124AD6|nr:RNA methyltransferase [Pseudoflavonifractor sp. MSJ-37]MBU5434172.1 RNA methyltransferase [Pseudoflavonifractor sp. MSJ-37]